MADEIILKVKGIMKLSEFDKSFFTSDHDVPCIYIGSQIVAIGHGVGDWNEKKEEHLRWKLEEGEIYIVTIRKVTE